MGVPPMLARLRRVPNPRAERPSHNNRNWRRPWLHLERPNSTAVDPRRSFPRQTRAACDTSTIYEDDGETYAYEKGRRATVELRWDDKSRTLSVGKRQGSFPGMVAERELRVVLASDSTGAGLDEPKPDAARSVRYTGKALVVKF